MHSSTCLRFAAPALAALCLCIGACSDSNDKLPGTEKNAGPNTPGMLLIAAGEFAMGSDAPDSNRDEKPAHTVFISAFYIDRCEVTNAEYRRFVLATGHTPPRVEADWAEPYNWIGSDYPPGTDMDPVVLVSWHDAAAFAAWNGKRLPTEAEWEKAARAGMAGRTFPYGDILELNQANYFKSYLRSKKLRPKGSFEPNALGLYDMAGNAWEWCHDWYGPGYYRKSAASNPTGPAHGEYKVFRGGSWRDDVKFLRCAQRGKNSPDYKSPTLGFRCVRSADQPETRNAESDG